MKALNYQESQKTRHDREIPRKVSSEQGLGAFEKTHVSAEKNIDDVECNGCEHPGQRRRGRDF